MAKVRVAAFSVSLDGYGAGRDAEPRGAARPRRRAAASRGRGRRARSRRCSASSGGSTGVDDDFAAAQLRRRRRLDPRPQHVRSGPRPVARRPLERLVGRRRRRTTRRCSSSPTTRARRSTWTAARPSTSSPTASRPRSSVHARRPAGATCASAAASRRSAQYLRAGLVDELHLALTPALLGGGEALLADIDLAALGFARARATRRRRTLCTSSSRNANHRRRDADRRRPRRCAPRRVPTVPPPRAGGKRACAATPSSSSARCTTTASSTGSASPRCAAPSPPAGGRRSSWSSSTATGRPTSSGRGASGRATRSTSSTSRRGRRRPPAGTGTFYRPFVALALEHDVPLVAANVSSADATRIVRGGYAAVFDAGDAGALGLDRPIDPATGGARRSARSTPATAARCRPTLWPRMARAQYARDAVMAQTLRAHARRGAVLLAGNGHARRDIGVPRWLALDPDRVLVDRLSRDRQRRRRPRRSTPSCATAPAPRDDPCARFRQPSRRVSAARSHSPVASSWRRT